MHTKKSLQIFITRAYVHQPQLTVSRGSDTHGQNQKETFYQSGVFARDLCQFFLL
jgi:hypothetical protein